MAMEALEEKLLKKGMQGGPVASNETTSQSQGNVSRPQCWLGQKLVKRINGDGEGLHRLNLSINHKRRLHIIPGAIFITSGHYSTVRSVVNSSPVTRGYDQSRT